MSALQQQQYIEKDTLTQTKNVQVKVHFVLFEKILYSILALCIIVCIFTLLYLKQDSVIKNHEIQELDNKIHQQKSENSSIKASIDEKMSYSNIKDNTQHMKFNQKNIKDLGS